MKTVIVIGGGASGLMAALTAAQNKENRVLILERQQRIGRKLLATGNGRCNLTNTAASPSRYHGEDAEFARPALEAFSSADTLAFFSSLGLLTEEEYGGRVYPLSNSANSVLDVLRLALERADVELHTASCVVRARKEGEGFVVDCENERFRSDALIVACGGMAGERFGGTKLGYRLLEDLGHHCTPLRWSLVQLRSGHPGCPSLKGIRADAGVKVVCRGKLLAEASGEVQFTDYGLSGPAIFEVSRAALAQGDTVVSLDLLRAVSEDELTAMLLRRASGTPQLTLGDAFLGTVQNRIGRVLISSAGLKASESIGKLDEKTARRLAKLAKHFEFPVTGDMGPANAQVTVGGIRTSEFDPETLESRLCPGLYACGEVLDIDGDCGGYNLQWAWSSGRLAGHSAAGV